jgi:phosphoglycerate kinase
LEILYMFKKMTLKDIEVAQKKVLVREDLNVPISDGRVEDETRIVAALPTINYLINQGAAVIIISHLGRPGGERNEEYSLKPVAEYLGKLLKKEVRFVPECIGPNVKKAVAELQFGDVLILENTRFHPGETENEPELGKELASLADIFVNDAFGTLHRAHASNVGVAAHLPTVAGLLIEKELKYLGNVIESPQKPFTAILGGAKVSDKIGVIRNLLAKVDHILIGGGMANTFFASKGIKLGASLVETSALGIASEIMEKAGEKLILPVDIVIGDKFSADALKKNVPVGDLPDGWLAMDIGPETIKVFRKIIVLSKTIVWNGPMGVFEFPAFSSGTFELARIIADSKALSIVGGGDSAAAVNQAGLEDQFTHVSTGGGASLQMLEGVPLPGLEVIQNK